MTPYSQWLTIPAHLRPGLARYLLDGVLPGGFLCRVLSNDLFGAAISADAKSFAALGDIAKFLEVYMPSAPFGSTAALHQWRALPGEERRRKIALELEDIAPELLLVLDEETLKVAA